MNIIARRYVDRDNEYLITLFGEDGRPIKADIMEGLNETIQQVRNWSKELNGASYNVLDIDGKSIINGPKKV